MKTFLAARLVQLSPTVLIMSAKTGELYECQMGASLKRLLLSTTVVYDQLILVGEETVPYYFKVSSFQQTTHKCYQQG
ncbi:MAG: hypothetical protein LBS41_00230 [Streptococcaceae bacterium]|jgi:hypothetical protein|nr:hypothetical protein [Streptococcaceae bacterium]